MTQSQDKVAILLCTCNGDRFLAEQLESLSSLQWPVIDIWASDDQSSDNTPALLESAARNWRKGRFELKTGPAKGFAANFLSLATDPGIEASYYAYCDQDDLWKPRKLDNAIAWLSTQPDNMPALYCSRTELVDEQGQHISYSPVFKKRTCFRNAIIQNIAGGNTMVMNKAARALLVKAGRQNIISHDWWTYMLVTGAGGEVFYDIGPQIAYRQHETNQMGHNNDTKARWKRVRMLLKGTFRSWNEVNILALTEAQALLIPDSRLVLEQFRKLRNQRGFTSVYNLSRSGIFRQTRLGNIALWVAAAFGKL